MNWLTIMGGTACLGLSGVIAAEMLTDIGPVNPAIVSMPSTVAEQTGGAARVSSSQAAAVQTIGERPVFSPNRRPAAAATAVPMLQVDMTVKPFTRKLTGIVVEPSLRAAVFAGDGSRSVVVKEGEPIDGWFLETVTPASVTMRAAGTSQEIALIKTKTPSNQSAPKPTTPSFMSPLLQVPPPSMATREPASPLVPSAVRPVR